MISRHSSRRAALALKEAYQCGGVSTRQHNEPSGYQDVWHYHLHVFPRYENDDLYLTYREGAPLPPEQRRIFAEKLKNYLGGTI